MRPNPLATSNPAVRPRDKAAQPKAGPEADQDREAVQDQPGPQVKAVAADTSQILEGGVAGEQAVFQSPRRVFSCLFLHRSKRFRQRRLAGSLSRVYGV
jgi:hypothetical protein